MVVTATAAALSVGAGEALAQGTIKICQSASNGMADRQFQFTLNGGAPFTVLGGRCSAPIATAEGNVTVETLQSDPPTKVQRVSVTPSERLVSQDLRNRRVVVAVLPGEVRLLFTNEPAFGTASSSPGGGVSPPVSSGVGTIEVCKAEVAGITTQPTFAFQIDPPAGLKLSVRGGQCSFPMSVSAGRHTVVEYRLQNSTSATYSYELVDIGVMPPDRQLVESITNSGAIAGSTVVEVPAGGVANETVVIFRNRIRQATFKICKQISTGSEDALGLRTFGFTWTVNTTNVGMPPAAKTGTDMLSGGECSTHHGPYPVLNPDGSSNFVDVTESGIPNAAYEVEDITYQGAGMQLSENRATGMTRFTLGAGVNVVTYIDRARPAP